MNKINLIVMLLILSGCTTLKGPISGKNYKLGIIPGSLRASAVDPDYCHSHYIWVNSKNSDYVQECRQYFVNKYPDTPKETKEIILNGKIAIGMTSKQAMASWGYPLEINRSVYSSNVREQWIYHSSYLYFKNGILTSWQD